MVFQLVFKPNIISDTVTNPLSLCVNNQILNPEGIIMISVSTPYLCILYAQVRVSNQ